MQIVITAIWQNIPFNSSNFPCLQDCIFVPDFLNFFNLPHQWFKIKAIYFFPRPMRSTFFSKCACCPYNVRLCLQAHSCSTTFNSIISNLLSIVFEILYCFLFFLTTGYWKNLCLYIVSSTYAITRISFSIFVSIIQEKIVTEESKRNSLISISLNFDLGFL